MTRPNEVLRHARPFPPRAAALAVLAVLAAPAIARAEVPAILFVGNSFTHGRYDPVRTYRAGFGPGHDHVHDDNCLDAASCSRAEARPARPPAQGTAEYGPFGGIPGIVLQLTEEAGLAADVSINAVSSATLAGTGADAARTAAIADNPLTGRPFDIVVLQEQSVTPLPPVNALGRPTRGNPAAFARGIDRLASTILNADKAAGRQATRILLYETQPLAADTYPSPLLAGRHVVPPYAGAPIEAMATDLHDAYARAAARNPAVTGVAFAGDAWIAAIARGAAERNPFQPDAPSGPVDLWDSDLNAACCVTPIGYHPSSYGAYLTALALFARITAQDPARFGPGETAARQLGIAPAVAAALQQAAGAAAASR